MTGWPAASRASASGIVRRAVVGAGEGDPDERAIRSVGSGAPERLEVDRDDPDAVLAGALGDELLRPRAEARDLVVGQERQLVAAGLRERRRWRGPASTPGLTRRVRLAARAEHRDRRREQRVEVEADERRRHEPDVGQRRVATADVGRVEEDLAEVVVVGDRLDAPARDR